MSRLLLLSFSLLAFSLSALAQLPRRPDAVLLDAKLV